MSTVSVRRAGAADAGTVLRLITELAAHEGYAGSVRTDADRLQRDGLRADGQFDVLLAERNDQVLGFVSFTTPYSIWLASRYLLVDDLFVRAEARGSGVGALLMRAIATECCQQHYPMARWTVERDNQMALRFYQKLGSTIVDKKICSWSQAQMQLLLTTPTATPEQAHAR